MSRTVTLTELITRARTRSDMTNSHFCTDTEVTQMLNDSICELNDLLMEKYGDDYLAKTGTIPLVAGTSSYNLPSDFLKLLGVDITSVTPKVSLQRYELNERNSTAAGDQYNMRYHLFNDSLYIDPAPAQSFTATLWYVPVSTLLATGTSTFDGRNGWDEYIVVDTAIKMKDKEESDTTVLRDQKQRLMQRIEVAAANRDVGNPTRVIDVMNRYRDTRYNYGIRDTFF